MGLIAAPVFGQSGTITNIQDTATWMGSGQTAASLYQNCYTGGGSGAVSGTNYNCGTDVNWTMTQGQTSPITGAGATSAKFFLGGTTGYSDALWYNHTIGDQAPTAYADAGNVITSAARNFTYSGDFYLDSTNLPLAQAMEFDVNWYLSTVGITWGTQCNLLGDTHWDVWNPSSSTAGTWVDTGFPCAPVAGWNHFAITVHRNVDNTALYETLTLNSTVNTVNRTVPSFTVPSTYHGVTVNYQMDGNSTQADYTSYGANLTLSYAPDLNVTLDETTTAPAYPIGNALTAPNQYAYLDKKDLLSFSKFQPQTYRAVYNVGTTGSTSGFTADIYDNFSSIEQNNAAGYNFRVIEHGSSGAAPGTGTGGAVGCTGTIATNTYTGALGAAPTFTFSAPCSAPLTANDSVVIESPPGLASTTMNNLGWTITGIRTVTDGTVTAGSPNITSPTIACTSADVGKYLTVKTSVGATSLLNVPITACISGGVTINVNAPTSLASAKLSIDSAGVAVDSTPADMPPTISGFSPVQEPLITNTTGHDNGFTGYLDSTAGQLNQIFTGAYTMTIDAKVVSGSGLTVKMAVKRGSGVGTQINVTSSPSISGGWTTYTFHFTGSETSATAVGTVAVTYNLIGTGSALFSNPTLIADADLSNPTAYKNSTISQLQQQKLGILRFNGVTSTSGYYLADLLKPAAFRPAGSASNQSWTNFVPVQDSPQEIFQLAQYAGIPAVEYTAPLFLNPTEQAGWSDYLGGTGTYGTYRANLGQTATWNSVFTDIYSEVGNEVWNTGNRGAMWVSYTSGTYWNAIPYTISFCSTLEASTGWSSVDHCVGNVQEATPTRQTAMFVAADTGVKVTHLDSAWYSNVLGLSLNASSQVCTTSQLLQDEWVSAWADNFDTNSAMYKTAQYAISSGRVISGYEGQGNNFGGVCPQSVITGTTEGVGAAGSLIMEPLMKQITYPGKFRDIFFVEYGNHSGYSCTSGSLGGPLTCVAGEKIGLWNSFNTLGNQVPSNIALQMANTAIGTGQWEGAIAKGGYTFNHSSSNGIPTENNVSYCVALAGNDGTRRFLIVNNANQLSPCVVSIAGTNAPTSVSITQTLLTSANITDSNEVTPLVAAATTTVTGTLQQVPPFSMATYSWSPTSTITSVAVSCPSPVAASNPSNCSSTVSGTGGYSSAVTYSASGGSINSGGVFTSSALGTYTITSRSAQDPTKTGTTTVTVNSPPPTITSVTLSCSPSIINTATTSTCTPTVTGTGLYSTAVNYSRTGSAGSVSSGGVFTPTAAGTATITATSVADGTKSGSATVTVNTFTPATTPAVNVCNGLVIVK